MRRGRKLIAALLAVSLFFAEPMAALTVFAEASEGTVTESVQSAESEQEAEALQEIEESAEGESEDLSGQLEDSQTSGTDSTGTAEQGTSATWSEQSLPDATSQGEDSQAMTVEEFTEEDTLSTDGLTTDELTTDGQTSASAAAGVSLTHLKVTRQNNTKGTFHVEVKGLGAKNGIQKVQIPIWSKTGGQDDLVWYTATKWSEGVYYVDVKASNHKYSTGVYNIHLYVTDGKGTFSYITETTTTVAMASPKVTASLNSNQTTCTLTAEYIRDDATKVYIPTWSETGGQDDLKWYEAKKVGSGKWQVSVSISSHKTWGTYQSHVYAVVDGQQSLQCKTTFKVSTPTYTHLKVTRQDNSKGTFHVEVKGLSAKNGISKVQIPIWSETDGQDDLKWYTATKWSTGTYYVDVNISNHKYSEGVYNIHLYVTDNTGTFGYITKTTVTVDTGAPKITATVNAKQTSCTLTAENVYSTAQQVYMPTWSDGNGQDDLKWYEAKKVSTGKWQVTVPISNHKTAGTYQSHLYMKESKNQTLLAKTTFTIDEATASKLTINRQNTTTGSFHVEVSGVTAKSGVQTVLVAIWSEVNGQDDLVWYTATKWSEGVYYVDVKASNHKGLGTYQVHAYVTGNNGVQNLVKQTTTEVQGSSYLYETDLGNGQYKLTAYNPNGGNVDTVNFAVWSDGNGQDDLVWYAGTKNSDGSYTATVDAKKHKSGGTFHCHLYGKLNGQDIYLAQTTFTVRWSDVISTGAKGIDVSVHQGQINWEQVKASGIEFAILRCGYGDNYTSQDDKCFARNVAECERLNISYGVYIYSYAQNTTQANSEADHVLRLLAGHTPSMPVFLDMEDNSTIGCDLASIATTFCNRITAAGYEVGVYANTNWWNTYLTNACFNNWVRWVAQYNTTCTYMGRYEMWQYSSTGSVSGISGNVDMNYYCP